MANYTGYKLVFNFRPEVVTRYNKLSKFEELYESNLIEAYAKTEPYRITQFDFKGSTYSFSENSYRKITKTVENNEIDETIISITYEEYMEAVASCREELINTLNEERQDIFNKKLFISDKENYIDRRIHTFIPTHRYNVLNFYSEIISYLNSNSKSHERAYTKDNNDVYTTCVDKFLFNSVTDVINAIAFLKRQYPCFMYHVSDCYLTAEGTTSTTVINFSL